MRTTSNSSPPVKLRSYTGSLRINQFDFSKHSQTTKPKPTKKAERFSAFLARYAPHIRQYQHIERLIDALQRIADGKLKRLMVFMPPRHGKSEITSRWFPAYYLTLYPQRWVGLLSYSAELAYGFSRNARANYEKAGRALSDAAWAVKQWETPEGGGVWATGIGGAVTGRGFHVGIIDDPIKGRKNAESATIRRAAQQFYDADFYTRQEPDAAIVLVNTRWHDDDLSGWLLRQETDEDKEPEGWHVVNMPAIMEQPHPFPASVTVEPDERPVGAALCPQRYSAARLNKIKSRNEFEFDALYQQRPHAPGGNIFKSEWWAGERNRYDYNDPATRNRAVARYMFVDTALKDKDTNDNSAYLVADLLPDYRAAVRRVYQEKIISALLPQWVETAAAEWNRDGKLKAVVIEDKGSGTTTLQTIGMTAPAWLKKLMTAYMPEGSKEYRARTITPLCAADTILLPHPCNEAEWLFDFADPTHGELFRFPNADHDDRVDTLTCMATYLMHYLQQAAILNRGKAAA